MLTLFISKLSTVSMATVDKIVEAILNEYRNTHQDEELIGDYGVHATNIAYTVVEAIVLEFIQQLNSGATNFTLDEFEVELDDDWEAIYASGEPVDDEFVGFVGRSLLRGAAKSGRRNCAATLTAYPSRAQSRHRPWQWSTSGQYRVAAAGDQHRCRAGVAARG